MSRSLASSLVFLICILPACGNRDAASEGSSDGSEPRTAAGLVIDPSNPLDVAEAFFSEIDDGDVEGASEWVLPELKDEFVSEVQASDFGLPEDYQVTVMANGDIAVASIVGTEIGVDMDLVDGHWWITH